MNYSLFWFIGVVIVYFLWLQHLRSPRQFCRLVLLPKSRSRKNQLSFASYTFVNQCWGPFSSLLASYSSASFETIEAPYLCAIHRRSFPFICEHLFSSLNTLGHIGFRAIILYSFIQLKFLIISIFFTTTISSI